MSELQAQADTFAQSQGFEDWDDLARQVYKSTPSGVSLMLNGAGFRVSSICEGTEAEFSSDSEFPIPEQVFWQMVKDMDEAAVNAWDETHGCPGCASILAGGTADSNSDVWDPGETPVVPDCPKCGGEGWVI